MPEALSDGCDVLKIPELAEYYHGYIDRSEAERRLRDDGTPSSYLLRLSRITHNNDKWESIYVLSYLSSTAVCYHFRLIPRLNCFQLGGRLFDCLQGCLSRYYVHDIMVGERLRHPVAPCSPPLEYHTQRLRAIQTFEPENSNNRLGCTVGDRFLLVHEDPKTDWVLVTSLKSRHSGYLPKCCVEKEYPELIERLDFFHPDALTSQPKDLLKKAGAFSYLLRPCDSLPGLYTLLLYDGVRVLKYRLELVVHSEPVIAPCTAPDSGTVDDDRPDGIQRRSSEPTAPIPPSPDTTPHHTNGDGDQPSANQRRRSGDSGPAPPLGAHSQTVVPNGARSVRYRTTTKVMYNGTVYESVEQVVAAIEAHPGPWHADASSQPNGNAAEGDVTPSPLASSSPPSLTEGVDIGLHEQPARDDADSTLGKSSTHSAPVVFRPVRRERKPHPNPPSSAIYMALRSARQHAALEIHGELSMLVHQRKKWKSFYAQVDRKQGILTLKDGEKRKTEHFDLSKCDFYPVHQVMFDRPFCFGLLLYGASAGDREELVFSVDAPYSNPAMFCAGAAPTGSSNAATGTPAASGTRSGSFHSSDLDFSTYAGRPEDAPVTAPPPSSQGHKRLGFEWPTVLTGTAGAQSSSTNSTDPSALPNPAAASLETVFARWLRCIRLHCRNTKVDAANEEDVTRRQSHLRCYRTLEIKINNAKLISSTQGKSRREEPGYLVMLDGIEIARAYVGTSTVSITFDEFPFGFKKVEILNKEENKRKRSVALELELFQSDADVAAPADMTPVPRLAGDDLCVGSGDAATAPARRTSSTICAARDRCSTQATISYRELHVLPFCYYDQFRGVLRSCLDSELVPLCIHVWKNLPSEVSKSNFVSSLLVVTTELKCHLQLMVSLLKTDVTVENPNNSFRGNTLGSQMLDMYSNSVCSGWRNQCFKRVREEALNGPTMSSSFPSLSNLSLPLSGATSSNTGITNPGCPRGSISAASQRNPATNGPGRPYSLSSGACTTGSGSTGGGFEPLNCSGHSTSFALANSHTREQHEWHCRLIAIAVDDLISHVRQFPLQVRWVYSELLVSPLLGRGLHEDEESNAVVCNLVFLRGLCPSLSAPPNPARSSISASGSLSSSYPGCSLLPGSSSALNLVDSLGAASQATAAFAGTGTATPWTHSSTSSACSPGSSSSIPTAAASALKIVAKTLLALVSLKASSKADGLLTPEQFMDYRKRLLEEFRASLTSPLKPDEIHALDKLYETEAFRASCRSLSRELAQLANHFLEMLDSRRASPTTAPSAPSTTDSGCTYPPGTGCEFRLWDYSPPPPCPRILGALCELEDRTKQLIRGPRPLCALHK